MRILGSQTQSIWHHHHFHTTWCLTASNWLIIVAEILHFWLRTRYWWCRHTGSLTSYMATKLAGLKHGSGTLVCILYGNHHHNNDDDHHHQAVSSALMSWSSFICIWNLHLQVLKLYHTKSFSLSSSLVDACFLQQQNYWAHSVTKAQLWHWIWSGLMGLGLVTMKLKSLQLWAIFCSV